jgi:hypothetical protein
MGSEFFEYFGTEVGYSLGHTEPPIIGDGIEDCFIVGFGGIEVVQQVFGWWVYG